MVNELEITRLIREESVLIDRGAIGELYETALKFVGIGIGGIMYTAGKKGGARGAQLLRTRLGLQGDDLLEAALIAFNLSNWGKATLMRDSESGAQRVQVEDSALAASVPTQKKANLPSFGRLHRRLSGRGIAEAHQRPRDRLHGGRSAALLVPDRIAAWTRMIGAEACFCAFLFIV